ncbi:MAG: HD domain-containing protein [Firmicutes bacterium]|nr:HD domain-containing protein [Bacillota bacterium]
MNDIERAQKYISGRLSEKRLAHTLSVAEETGRLCSMLGVMGDSGNPATPAGRMRLAALLHDATKEESSEYNLKLCKECDIILDNADLACPSVIHGKSASGLAARKFGLEKPFCSAVFYHTTGRAEMSLFEKILYVADYIEKNRDYDECIEARKFFYDNATGDLRDNQRVLDRTALMAVRATLRSLEDRKKPVHPDSLSAAEWLECICR